jgi:Ca2+-binding RTX toxin-like protein
MAETALTLDFRKTTGDVHLYGEGDNDYIYGGSGNDHLSGGAALDWIEGGDGNDKIGGGDYIDDLFGNAGHDDLWGDAGNDILDGGSGLDDLIGGAGRDYLTGGSGYDMFWFEIPDGWTDSKVSDPDHILDFNGADDWINMPVAGTTSSNIFQTGNYIDAQMGGFAGCGYDVARNWAENHITGNVRYAFVSDGVNGYLFGDLNGNGTVETGIVLEGVTSITQFDYSNIM